MLPFSGGMPCYCLFVCLLLINLFFFDNFSENKTSVQRMEDFEVGEDSLSSIGKIKERRHHSKLFVVIVCQLFPLFLPPFFPHKTVIFLLRP